MKNLLTIALLLPLAVFAQDGRNLLKDRVYKKHSDSSAYYYNLWQAGGRKNRTHEQKMLYYREQAMDRSWFIYDSTSKANKP